MKVMDQTDGSASVDYFPRGGKAPELYQGRYESELCAIECDCASRGKNHFYLSINTKSSYQTGDRAYQDGYSIAVVKIVGEACEAESKKCTDSNTRKLDTDNATDTTPAKVGSRQCRCESREAAIKDAKEHSEDHQSPGVYRNQPPEKHHHHSEIHHQKRLAQSEPVCCFAQEKAARGATNANERNQRCSVRIGIIIDGDDRVYHKMLVSIKKPADPHEKGNQQAEADRQKRPMFRVSECASGVFLISHHQVFGEGERTSKHQERHIILLLIRAGRDSLPGPVFLLDVQKRAGLRHGAGARSHPAR